MLVDDEPLARAGLREMLRAHDDVDIVGDCGDGQEALDRIETLEPDLVFLDIQMPALGGFEVLEQLHGTPPAIVFVTAYGEHALRAFRVDAIDYLLKPVNPVALAGALDRVRDRLGARPTHSSHGTADDLNPLFRRQRESGRDGSSAGGITSARSDTPAGRDGAAPGDMSAGGMSAGGSWSAGDDRSAGERSALNGNATHATSSSTPGSGTATGSVTSAVNGGAPGTNGTHAPHYLPRIFVREGERGFFVRTADVEWAQSAGNYLRIAADGREYLIRATMQELEQKLDPYQFTRIHRRTIVNLERVTEIATDFRGHHVVRMKDGSEHRLSRTFRERLLGRPL